jgi:hypothetical protein
MRLTEAEYDNLLAAWIAVLFSPANVSTYAPPPVAREISRHEFCGWHWRLVSAACL